MKATLFDLLQQRIHDIDLPHLPEILVARGREARVFLGAAQIGPDKSVRGYYETTHLEISWMPSGEVVVESPAAQAREELQILASLVLAVKIGVVGAPVATVRSTETAIDDLRRLARDPKGLTEAQASMLRAVVGVP